MIIIYPEKLVYMILIILYWWQHHVDLQQLSYVKIIITIILMIMKNANLTIYLIQQKIWTDNKDNKSNMRIIYR